MLNRLRRFASTTPAAALADERGVAAVEFALLGTLMLTLLAGGVDLTNALIVQRDVARLSNEVAQALTGCGGETCVITNGSAINARLKNIAPGLDGITIGFTNVQRLNNTIVAQGGNMTYLPADMTTVAKSVLPNEKDWGFNLANFRSYAVTLRVKA